MNNSNDINPIWILAQSYSVQHSAALIADIEPLIFHYSDNGRLHSNKVYQEIDSRYENTSENTSKEAQWVQTAYVALKNSINDGSLNAQLKYLTYPEYVKRFQNTKLNNEDNTQFIEPITQDEFFSNPTIDWSETTVTREDLKQWMLSRNFTSSKFFFGGLASNEPDYMNPQHARYSEELAATVKAWQAMEDENLLLGKSSPKSAMIDWLTTRYNELGLIHEGKISNEGIKDCAKVANWSDSRSNKNSKKANLPTP